MWINKSLSMMCTCNSEANEVIQVVGLNILDFTGGSVEVVQLDEVAVTDLVGVSIVLYKKV
jgi:hypothetical protein